MLPPAARRGQDPSLQSTRERQFVGSGLDRSVDVFATVHGPGGIYAAPTKIPGRLVGDAYMRPGQLAAAAMYTGGINPSPTDNKTGAAHGNRPG